MSDVHTISEMIELPHPIMHLYINFVRIGLALSRSMSQRTLYLS